MVARFFVRSIFWLPPRGKLRCGGRQTAPYRCVDSRKPGRAACPAHKTADFGAKMRLRCDFGRKNRPPSSAVRENHPTCTLRTECFSAILIAIHKFLSRRLHLWTTPALPTAIYARRARFFCGTICTRQSSLTRASPTCEIDVRSFFDTSFYLSEVVFT